MKPIPAQTLGVACYLKEEFGASYIYTIVHVRREHHAAKQANEQSKGCQKT
jgi:hypothetical protein